MNAASPSRPPESHLALQIDPLVNRITAFAEILMEIGGNPFGQITPSTMCLIGGDIDDAARQISEMIVAALRDGKPEEA